jgi:hypothetical protein
MTPIPRMTPIPQREQKPQSSVFLGGQHTLAPMNERNPFQNFTDFKNQPTPIDPFQITFPTYLNQNFPILKKEKPVLNIPTKQSNINKKNKQL